MSTLGNRIREARAAAGMTQMDLAFALRGYPLLGKVDQNRVSEWEHNKPPRLSFVTIDAVAAVTGVPIGFFSAYEAAEQPATAPPNPALESTDAAAALEAARGRERRANADRRRGPGAKPRSG